MSTRRGFITGLISFVAAPAIVRVGSLMPVKVMDEAIVYGRGPALEALPTLEEWAETMARLQGQSRLILARTSFYEMFQAVAEGLSA